MDRGLFKEDNSRVQIRDRLESGYGSPAVMR